MDDTNKTDIICPLAVLLIPLCAKMGTLEERNHGGTELRKHGKQLHGSGMTELRNYGTKLRRINGFTELRNNGTELRYEHTDLRIHGQ